MVTASHNPRGYNGYKVYGPNGAQIVPPHDTAIAARIALAPEADEVVLANRDLAKANGLLHFFSHDVDRRYFDGVHRLSLRADGDRGIPIVYTPLHGTGERFTRTVLTEGGFFNVTTVPSQAEPDGSFPTVSSPNPEEKGALDLAISLAKERNAELVLANDPDVDRLAVAVRDADGSFVQLTGNQVGALLGHDVLTAGKAAEGRRVVITSPRRP
jgi:phosphomannomutase